MKTRVLTVYDIRNGVQLYGVQCWNENPPGQFDPYTKAVKTQNPHWENWPHPLAYAPEWTPDEDKARRIARELSAGGTVPIEEVLMEYADGVAFSPVDTPADLARRLAK